MMSRGVARMPTFLDDEDRRAFLGVLGGLVEQGAIEVHAYCLMPNHYHVLIRTPRGELARWMRHVNGDYVRGFNVRHRRVGWLWQGRYKAIVVENAAYLKECSRYIHLNPNRAKMARPAERYRWSSYRNYVGGPKAAPWVETKAVLGEFGGDRGEYRTYVEAGKGEKQVSPFERAVAGLVLGGEEFVGWVRNRLKGKADTRDEPQVQKIRRTEGARPEQVEAACHEVFATERPVRKRRLLLYVQRLHSRLRPAEIARRYGRTRGAVTQATRSLETEARRDPALAAGLRRLDEILKT